MKWRSYSYCKNSNHQITLTKTLGTINQCCSPPLESHLTGQGTQVGFCPWDTNMKQKSLWKGHPFSLYPLQNGNCWSPMFIDRVWLYENYMAFWGNKYYGNLGCIRVFMAWYSVDCQEILVSNCQEILVSMLPYISKVSCKWGGIYLRMSYCFISQVVSKERLANILISWMRRYKSHSSNFSFDWSQFHQPTRWPDPSTLEQKSSARKLTNS